MKRILLPSVSAVAICFLMCAVAEAGDVEDQVAAVKNQLNSNVKVIQANVKEALGIPFEEQVGKAMEELKKNPRSLKLQLNVIDILMAHADRVTNTFQKTKDADLATLRDRVVKGLEALAAAQIAAKDQNLARAKEAKGEEWKRRYEELAGACDRLARAYSAQAEQYRAVPLGEQLLQIQMGIEYLGNVKQVLVSLRDGIGKILSDDETLRELQRVTVSVNGIQQSLKSFSETVLAGALAGE